MKMYVYILIMALTMGLLVSCAEPELSASGVADVLIKDSTSASEQVVAPSQAQTQQNKPSSDSIPSGDNVVLEGIFPIEPILKATPGKLADYKDEFGAGYNGSLVVDTAKVSEKAAITDGSIKLYTFGGQWGGTDITFTGAVNDSFNHDVAMVVAPYVEAVIGKKLSDEQLISIQDMVREGNQTTDIAICADVPTVNLGITHQEGQYTIQMVPA